jgi:3-deoxy-D-manno-octulosonic-acid transferase
MLQLFTHVFVQDDQSKNLLATIHIAENVSVAGDTRFDRVAETMRESFSNEALEHFCNNNQVLIAGSSWKEDEEALAFVQSKIPHLKIIIAPHEINASHLDSIKSIFKDAVLLSEYSFDQPAKVLIIDSIGMLSKIYRYATIAYVGGGFNLSGIHNVLEAAAYGKVVCWGPNYNRSAEASRMLELG